MWSDLWSYLVREAPQSTEASEETLLKLWSFVVWSALYIALMVRGGRSAEWCCRVVTLLHGTVATAAGLWQCGLWSLSGNSFLEPCQSPHYALMLMSWGYFAFDLLWCLTYWRESFLMLCHHATALLCITRFMQNKMAGSVFGCSLGALEITNPLLQIRWFLRDAKRDSSIVFVVVESVYLLTFLVVRGFVGTYIAYVTLKSEEASVDIKVMGVLLYVVSLGFIRDIVNFALKKYPSRLNDQSQNVQFWLFWDWAFCKAMVKESIATKFHRATD